MLILFVNSILVDAKLGLGINAKNWMEFFTCACVGESLSYTGIHGLIIGRHGFVCILNGLYLHKSSLFVCQFGTL